MNGYDERAARERRDVFTGRVVSLGVERVVLPNGRETDLEIIRHPGGAAVVAIDESRRLCLLRQFRHAAGGWLWELPAGKIDDREPPEETATRELAEEAGVSARRWERLGAYISSPGVFTEIIHLYLARGLVSVPARLEPDEVLEVHWVRFDAAIERVRRGEIEDAKTALGILRAAQHLRT